MTESDESLRLDIWLWRARFLKPEHWHQTMSVAVVYASADQARSEKSASLAPQLFRGDVLTFSRGGSIQVIRVLAIGTRRGPASEAAELYEIVEGS